MTTIYYNNGKLYADTRWTDLNTGETGVEDKIFVGTHFVGAGCGNYSVVNTLNSGIHRLLYKLFRAAPFGHSIHDSMLNGKSNVLIFDRKNIIGYRLALVKFGWLRFVKSKIVAKYSIDDDVALSMGSGTDNFDIHEYADTVGVKKAFEHAASLDKYTNDVTTEIDVKEYLGVKVYG